MHTESPTVEAAGRAVLTVFFFGLATYFLPVVGAVSWPLWIGGLLALGGAVFEITRRWYESAR